MNKKEIILETGELFKEIVSWVRDVRNKHNILKDKITLYIDLLSKEPSFIDIELFQWEEIMMKYNICNLSKIEYSLYNLFENNSFFEATQIKGTNFYIPLVKISKEEKINEIYQEIDRINSLVIKCNQKLLNKSFIENAPKEVVLSENKKKSDFLSKIHSLRQIITQLECGKEHYNLLIKFGSQEKINWHVQYFRETNSVEELYSENWMNEIYNPYITKEEIIKLNSLFF